jgi:putative DNA primase/helicase
MKLLLANVPKTLTCRNQWLLWKLEDRDGKPSKVPYCVKTGRYGKSNDSTTWGSFEDVTKAVLNGGGYDGIGFAFHKEDGVTGIDVDHPWDSPIAAAIREKFRGTYCERSPSGKLRVFCFGAPKRCGRGTEVKTIEVYNYTSARYLTVTGDWIEGTVKDVTEQQEALDWLHEVYFKPKEEAKPQPKFNGSSSHDDQWIIDKARTAGNGGKFAALFYDGSWQVQGYPSPSEADSALCSLLAFYTRDEGQIDRLFRQSALMRLRLRRKWDEKHHSDGRTYG